MAHSPTTPAAVAATIPLTGRRRTLAVVSVMLATFLAALDATVVSTAMPRIVASLGGFSMLSWVFSAYLFAAAATVPVFGKLADRFGRKRVFIIGALLFLAGSLLCGQAQSMVQLIAFRALQGLGAGAIIPLTLTIIADLYSPRDRARMQGLTSGVWGLSSIIGPATGGLITDFIGWRWVFLMNLPVGLLAIALFWAVLPEQPFARRGRIDYAGFVTLVTGITALFAVLRLGGVLMPWSSPVVLGLAAAAVLLLLLFIFVENRATDPMLPLGLFRNRMVAVADASVLVGGAVFMSMLTFIPLYAQGVEGLSATRAGGMLVPLSLSWSAASILGARLLLRYGYRFGFMLGLALQLVATVGLVYFSHRSLLLPGWALLAVMISCGLGIGFLNVTATLGVQEAVGIGARGVATASVSFFRYLGQTTSVALLGSVLNLGLLVWLPRLAGVPVADSQEALAIMNRLLDPATGSLLPAAEVAALRAALAAALRGVYWTGALLALFGLLLVPLLPRARVGELAARVTATQAPGTGA